MNNVVQEFKVLKKKSNEALKLLKKIASQVMPIMRKRGWRVTQLCEFFPKNPNLLGTNVNRGFKIYIRLRPHYDDTVFLDYNDLLGTMLHELAHIARGPHDATFYKIFDELNNELDDLLISGQQGYMDVDCEGHRLGGIVAADAKRQALEAAERRRRLQTIMLPSGGVRLGGSGSGKSLETALGPAQMAAYAAERRLKDQKWCGGLQEQEDGSSSSTGGSDRNSTNGRSSDEVILISDDDDDNDRTKRVDRRRRRTSNPDDHLESAKRRAVIPVVASHAWACASCTFENDDLVLKCTVCLSERPSAERVSPVDPSSPSYWSCPQCTLLNKPIFLVCDACGREKSLIP